MTEFKNTRNPILPLEYHIPDGEGHVMPDGRLYLYGSLDKTRDTYCSDEYRVVSTDDMENWIIHDVSFRTSDAVWSNDTNAPKYSLISNYSSYDELPEGLKVLLPPEAKEAPFEMIVEGFEQFSEAQAPLYLYAPDAIEKNGKYYLYMCLSDNTEGVSVADSPEGPFSQAVQLPVRGIDPAVFIDNDGQAFYYWGQFSANAARLNPDMMSLDESLIVKDIVTEKEHYFHEGSSVRRHGDIYYFIFADISRGKPTCLGYATGDSPLGPFTYQGVIIDNTGCDPKTWNNHGSIEEFNGQWYVFYHRSSRNSNSMRRVCIEPIAFNEDGTIDEVEMTSQGAGKPFVTGEIIPAYTACCLSGGSYIDPFGDSEVIIGIQDGDTVIFRYIQSETTITKFHIDAEGESSVSVWLNEALFGTAEVSNGEIYGNAQPGIYELKLEFEQPCNFILHSIYFN